MSPRLTLTLGAIAIAVAAVTLALSGCSPVGAQSISVVPRSGALYHQFQTYPRIPVVPNVRYDTVAGQAVRLDLCLPDAAAGTTISPRPAIIAVHGGSWAHGYKASVDWRSVCQWLASRGYVAASIDYALTPKHVFPTAIHELEHAVDWLRAPAQVTRYSIDPSLIGVMGGSAGGNLAALLGTSGEGPLDSGHRVAAVVDLSGPINLTATGPERADLIPYQLRYLHCESLAECPDARAASPLYHVDPSDPPFFIGHSLSERIPLSQSSTFVKKLRANGVAVTFVTVKGDLHSVAMLDGAMRTRIGDFFHATLVHTLLDGVE